jgi:hypothetical protein
MTALRATLFAQLAELRETKADDPNLLRAAVAKAAAVSDLAKTITDTARVEVDYLRACGGGESAFIGGAAALPKGITGVTRHRLAG